LSIKRGLKSSLNSIRSLGKQKIFCVGRNKTGTTSLTLAMRDLGFRVGDQHAGELLIREWGRRNFRPIARYCRSAQFFQDIPFSLPYTFQAMDIFFPGSKFILTERDAEAWYRSMRKFHRQPGVHGDKADDLEALKEATYCYKGFAYDTKVLVYDLPGNDPYDKETLISHYHFHNRMVKDYFRNRPGDLLVLDVSEEGAYGRLCDFLEREPLSDTFPWENRTG
jgi:hypothetical protein